MSSHLQLLLLLWGVGSAGGIPTPGSHWARGSGGRFTSNSQSGGQRDAEALQKAIMAGQRPWGTTNSLKGHLGGMDIRMGQSPWEASNSRSI